jgi:PmbA protein
MTMRLDEFLNLLFQKAREAGISECEAYVSSGDSFEASVHAGELIAYNVSSTMGLGFRALVNGRMGYASTQALDEAAVDMLVKGVITSATLTETEDPQFIFTGGETPKLDLYNPALDLISDADKVKMALDLENKALAADPRIGTDGCAVVYSAGEKRIVNSKGLDVAFRDNALGAYVVSIAREDGRAGSAYRLRMSRDGAPDFDKLAREASTEALDFLSAGPVASGSFPVVLRASAAIELLAAFSEAFSADEAQRGLSKLAGREGEIVAAECVTIMDDPLNPEGFAAAPFDGEGVPARAKAVIDGGKLTTLLHNLKTAAKQGVQSTGNAARGYASAIAVAPSNFYFKPSDTPLDALMAQAEGGLLITELQGLHSGANAVSGDFSLSAKGYRIEGGKPGQPVDQITVAGNFFDLLLQVQAVGGDMEFGQPGGSCYDSPSLLVGKLSIAGK